MIPPSTPTGGRAGFQSDGDGVSADPTAIGKVEPFGSPLFPVGLSPPPRPQKRRTT